MRGCEQEPRARANRALAIALTLLSVAPFGLAACGGDDEAAARLEGSFVGRVQGSDAFVAVVTDGTRATAYVCDGRPGDRGGVVGERFDGKVRDGQLDLVSKRGAHFAADLRERAVSGTVRLSGEATALDFQAIPATGRAGYYRGEASDGRGEAAWVVLATGEQRGARTAPATRPGRMPSAGSDQRAGTGPPAPPPFDKFTLADRESDALVVPDKLQSTEPDPNVEEGLG